MKTTTPVLATYLNSLRAGNGDAPLYSCDLFIVWLASGGILTLTNLDIPVFWNGYVFSASSILISGLKYKASLGVSVDKQQISIAARATDTLGGIPFLQALQQGAFDGAEIQREKAFFTAWGTAPIGTVLMFKGRVAQIDSIGRTSAQVTVASDLTLLDIDMPRNTYQANCVHVFCDSGCGLASATYAVSDVVAGGSTQISIVWDGANAAYQQGTIVFTSGVNAGTTATIKAAGPGQLLLAYPLPNTPATGDGFTATQGCHHTMATCSGKFNNLAAFKGFPFVPPPQIMTGPLSSITTNQSK